MARFTKAISLALLTMVLLTACVPAEQGDTPAPIVAVTPTPTLPAASPAFSWPVPVTPAPGWIDNIDPYENVLEQTEEVPSVENVEEKLGVMIAFSADSVTYEEAVLADFEHTGEDYTTTGETVTLTVDENSQFWTLGFLEYFEYGRVSPEIFAKWLEYRHNHIYMTIYAQDGKLLMAVERYIP